MIELQNMGTTYSVVDPTIYDRFKSDGDAEIFEKLVMDLMLNKYSEDKELTEYILGLPKTKQRMAVLSVIDGDNVLWSKMNAYVNECSDKFDHIKDVVKIINKFVKDGEVEKKKFGEVMTPITLVREMLDTLPEDVWSNPNLKWLDPANGAGTFPFVVIYKLMNGLKDWEPDTEKRYKHIVEKMIYVCELQSRNVFLWLCGVDPKDEYTTNTYWGSFLDADFDRHMKDVWGVDKFDIVIGNPPYNKSNDGDGTNGGSLYTDFVIKSTKISERILFVIPLKWSNNSYRSFRESIIDFGIDNIVVILDGDSIFSTTGVGEICFLSLLNGSNTIKIVSDSTFEIEISKNRSILVDGFLFNKKHFDILSKIYNKCDSFMSKYYNNPQLIKTNLLPKTNKISVGGDLYLVRKSKGQNVSLNLKVDRDSLDKLKIDKYKICFEKIYGGYLSNSYSNLDIIYPGTITTEGISFFDSDSLEESIRIKNYLVTSFCKFLKSIKQYDRSYTSMVFSYIPILDFSVEWDDDRIFKYFGFQEDEIKMITSN